MKFLYYVPSGVTTNELAHTGGDSMLSREAGGPDGGRGMVHSSCSPADVGYYPDRQTWQPVPNSRIWIGYINDQMPTPDSLAKPMQVKGREVNGWLVPVAFNFAEIQETIVPLPSLDRYLRYTGEGWEYGQVLEEFQPLWGYAWEWWEQWCKIRGIIPGESQISISRAADIATRCLGFNYYVSAIELSIMKAMNESFLWRVLDTVIDLPGMEELAEKKALAGEQLNTDDGSPVVVDTSHHPSQISS